MNQPARIFISVAEDSADVHAASLVRAAQTRLPGCTFYGLTGPRMRAAGVETVFDLASHAAMLTGVLSSFRQGLRAKKAVVRSWQQSPPDLVILMDSPELHLRLGLARMAKRMGLPVLYYIAPQTWAWGEGRNRQIARDVDRMACILPFEQAFFRRSLVYADYVGHPLFESLRAEEPRADVVKTLRDDERPLVALLPGSRRHVIDTMLPMQLEVVRRVRMMRKQVRAVVSCVSEDRRHQIKRHINAGGFATEILTGDNASLLAAADLVLVASGTATLEVAHHRKPMIIMYDAGRTLRRPYRMLGRYCLNTRHLSLVNILAGARLVPEFMPFIADLQPVAEVARQLLEDAVWRGLLGRQLDALVGPLEESQASQRVCDIIAQMLAGRRAG